MSYPVGRITLTKLVDPSDAERFDNLTQVRIYLDLWYSQKNRPAPPQTVWTFVNGEYFKRFRRNRVGQYKLDTGNEQ